MENSDMFGSSTAPLTWHDFLERMRHPSAADFVKSIKSFIVSFSNSVPDPEKDSAAVQEFLSNMEGAFMVHSLWAGSSEEELESAGEGLEKYVMTKLFSRVFAAHPEDVKRDEELSEKMALVQQFIRPENLDIKPNFQNETSWLLAQKELQKMNMFKAPRDKLVCILNCCKVINNLLLNASIASNDNPPGADEFLPVLIYVTIKANPSQLHSNLLYIQRYRRQTRLVSEAAYFFTNMLSAESFISSINAKSLSIDETEFEKNMESALAVLSGLSSIPESPSNQNIQDGGFVEDRESKPESRKSQKASNVSSITDLEKRGAAELVRDAQMSSHFQEYPFLYAQAGDLTVADVEALLNGYKQLVIRYVSLSTVLASNSQSLPLAITLTDTKTRKEAMDTTEEKEVEVNSVNYPQIRRDGDVVDSGSVIDDVVNIESKLSTEPVVLSGE